MSAKRGKTDKLQDKLNEYIRVLKLAKKPGKDEYLKVAKISAIGILLIGSIGFFIYLGMGVLPQTMAGIGKGELSATFVNELNTSKSTQELTLRINNTDEESSTGQVHIQLTPVLCSVEKTNINVSSIDPGSSKNITIKVTDIEETSNVQANIWAENVASHDSLTTSLPLSAKQERAQTI
ncbi:protein translocase SEC61 complex subunit gamma [archaeon SCG-AAA382B04]|nr:protein translocase SEC61 complex subunit gamma [archaeon SCG-AAA382B04]